MPVGDLIKQALHEVLTQPELDPLAVIKNALLNKVPDTERDDVRALVIEELKRVHLGVLARYQMRPSQFEKWISIHRDSD